jgi:uncharacterized protein YndB with AHSA1/START domain
MAVHIIEIERPIEDVFAVLTDVTKTGRWYPARVEEWWVTPPPHGVGSVRRARVTVMGRASENDAVVTEYDPPRRAVLKGSAAGAPFEAALDFEPTAGGTQVRVETTFDLRGAMRVIGPLFIRSYERGWVKGLQTAKRMMESGELNPTPPASESASA